MNKEILIGLIVIAGAVAYFVEIQKQPITSQKRAAVEVEQAAPPEKYPATPA